MGALVARDLATGGGEWGRSCGVGTKTVKCQSTCKLLGMQASSVQQSSGQLEPAMWKLPGAESTVQLPRNSPFNSKKTFRKMFTTDSHIQFTIKS